MIKISRRTFLVATGASVALSALPTIPAYAKDFKEADSLKAEAGKGSLPPVGQRVSDNPLVVTPTSEVGRYGGDWNMALVGGGARSAWWSQLLADILEVPLTLGEGGEAGGALGAARLAWLADGGAVASVCTAPAGISMHDPASAQTGAKSASPSTLSGPASTYTRTGERCQCRGAAGNAP